jgi:hypothetical protein
LSLAQIGGALRVTDNGFVTSIPQFNALVLADRLLAHNHVSALVDDSGLLSFHFHS